MAEHQGSTDQKHRVQLASSIEQVMWTRSLATPGATVGLEIFTHHVGNGAEMEIALTDRTGSGHGTYLNKIFGNRLSAEVVVPETAEQAFYATVKLSKHGLKMTSAPLMLLPRIDVTNARWSQSEARRGEILTLTADAADAPNGVDASITVFEHDADGAHEIVTRVPAVVENEQVKVSWEFEFTGKVEDIPRHDETERGYAPPQFFFRLNVLGNSADSDLLTFKDFVEIRLQDADGEPVPGVEYELHLPDGSVRKGNLNDEANAREEDVPPGVYIVLFKSRADEEQSSAA